MVPLDAEMQINQTVTYFGVNELPTVIITTSTGEVISHDGFNEIINLNDSDGPSRLLVEWREKAKKSKGDEK